MEMLWPQDGMSLGRAGGTPRKLPEGEGFVLPYNLRNLPDRARDCLCLGARDSTRLVRLVRYAARLKVKYPDLTGSIVSEMRQIAVEVIEKAATDEPWNH